MDTRADRANFEVVSRLVAPGDPGKSPLLLHPLATEAAAIPRIRGASSGRPRTIQSGRCWPAGRKPEALPALRGGGLAGLHVFPRSGAADLSCQAARTCALRGVPRQSHAPFAGACARRTGWNEEESRKKF